MATSMAIALFTRDLRVHDNPVLSAATGADEIVPLFVLDSAMAGFAVPNRAHFLADSLADLDAGLGDLGAKLVLRHGRVVEQVRALAAELAATEVHIAADVSAYAQRRQQALGAALSADGRQLCVHDAVITVVAPGAVTPTSGDHFKVSTPYFRRWVARGDFGKRPGSHTSNCRKLHSTTHRAAGV